MAPPTLRSLSDGLISCTGLMYGQRLVEYMAELLDLIDAFGLQVRVVRTGEKFCLGVETYATGNLSDFMERSFKYGYPNIVNRGNVVILYWPHHTITLH